MSARAETAIATGAPLRWPPPPHDPRERKLALRCEGWEARVFDGRKFAYFVTRGLWHLQLWHRRARVSVLTPSRLTNGFYEAFPIANWKAQAATYAQLTTLIAGITDVAFLSQARLHQLERCLVDEIVRAAIDPRRLTQ